MGYVALSAFLEGGKLPAPTIEDLAKRLVHFDFPQANVTISHIGGAGGSCHDIAAVLIAKLIHQEIERVKSNDKID